MRECVQRGHRIGEPGQVGDCLAVVCTPCESCTLDHSVENPCPCQCPQRCLPQSSGLHEERFDMHFRVCLHQGWSVRLLQASRCLSFRHTGLDHPLRFQLRFAPGWELPRSPATAESGAFVLLPLACRSKILSAKFLACSVSFAVLFMAFLKEPRPVLCPILTSMK